ncbi:MAG TPA: hypothetical protein VLI05_04015 [Candidatus Saccharimonadia bacterium]|nr:hypothetical protein [Candidatus Saccharimonadia bacterium]
MAEDDTQQWFDEQVATPAATAQIAAVQRDPEHTDRQLAGRQTTTPDGDRVLQLLLVTQEGRPHIVQTPVTQLDTE